MSFETMRAKAFEQWQRAIRSRRRDVIRKYASAETLRVSQTSGDIREVHRALRDSARQLLRELHAVRPIPCRARARGRGARRARASRTSSSSSTSTRRSRPPPDDPPGPRAPRRFGLTRVLRGAR